MNSLSLFVSFHFTEFITCLIFRSIMVLNKMYIDVVKRDCKISSVVKIVEKEEEMVPILQMVQW